MKTPDSITLKSLKHWYEVFNQSFFNGNLPVIPLKLTPTKCTAGAVRFLPPRGIRRSMVGPQFVGQAFEPGEVVIIHLRMSTYYEVSEEYFKAILIHEMIHVELLSKGIAFTSGGDVVHGREFMERLKELQEESGLTIPVVSNRNDPASSVVKNKVVDVFIFERGSTTYLATFKSGFVTKERRNLYIQRFGRYKNLRFGKSDHRELLTMTVQRSDRRISFCAIAPKLAEEILPLAEVVMTAEQIATQLQATDQLKMAI